MDGTLLLLGASGALTSLGLWESMSHRRLLTRIPIRIHVNGTRGKSGVTRLIAAGLRAGGLRTCAKTTGTNARFVLPDGSEYPIFRPGRANIIEQKRIVRAAAAAQAEALVLECMALQPELQALSETRLVRATHGVITNARADHLDVMGPSVEDVALALSGTVPYRARLYTAERQHLETLQQAAIDRGSELVSVDAEIPAITRRDLAGFSYIEHAENVALALKVCVDLGVDRQTALRGMWSAQPDDGVLTTCERFLAGRRIMFVNGFAANDPDSTGQIWNMVVSQFPHLQKRIAVFNCRADRPDRSRQLAECCTQWQPADHYLLVGSGTEMFARRALQVGLDPSRLALAEGCSLREIIDRVCDLAGPSALVMGMGNISGPGLQMLEFFRSQSPESPQSLAA